MIRNLIHVTFIKSLMLVLSLVGKYAPCASCWRIHHFLYIFAKNDQAQSKQEETQTEGHSGKYMVYTPQKCQHIWDGWRKFALRECGRQFTWKLNPGN